MLPRCSQLSVRRALPMLGSPTLRPIAFHLPELRPTPATSTRRLLRQATGCMHVPVTPGRRLNMGILQHKKQAPDYKEIPLEAGPSQEARHAAGMDVHRSPGATCSHATDTSTRLPCNATSSPNIINYVMTIKIHITAASLERRALYICSFKYDVSYLYITCNILFCIFLFQEFQVQYHGSITSC